MKIVAFVHTEYHLMLTVNEILKNPDNSYRVYIMQKPNQRRLQIDFDFSGFANADFERIEVPTNYKGNFSKEHVQLLSNVRNQNYDQLYFFQEMDEVLLSIVKTLKKTKQTCEICLFQDGLKPYNRMKGYSIGMLKWDIQIWRWLWRNGVKEIKPFKLLHTKKYAYTDEVDTVYLTFPDAYINWNNKVIKKIEFCDHAVFKATLEKLFGWDDKMLPINQSVILYMTQPMHHNPNLEFDFLNRLKSQLNRPLILKLHPLTSRESIEKYKSIADDVFVVNSVISAEIFIMNLNDSIIVSLNSTSMFYNSPNNRYYYVSNLFMDKIKRLRRYAFYESPSKHIKMVKQIEDIK